MKGRGIMAIYVVAYDIGTTGVKSCLFSISEEEKIKYIDGHLTDYHLYLLDNGGAEQDPDEWWDAICTSTNAMMHKNGIPPEMIKGISFCGQMQCLILVDKDGKVLRPSMNYLDARATKQFKEGIAFGTKIAGMPVLPNEEEFPYAIRVVSEILSSNGSSSQASVCGSTMALMDAGVPIRKPVAGIAMGLIEKTDEEGNVVGEPVILSDIQGMEDFLGDMRGICN